jgi:hypothetical protein
MCEERWIKETERLVYRALNSKRIFKLNQLLNIRLERNAMCQAREPQFAKDKPKNMLAEKIKADFFEYSTSEKPQAMFDDQFHFISSTCPIQSFMLLQNKIFKMFSHNQIHFGV